MVRPRAQTQVLGQGAGLHTEACPLQASTARPSEQELPLDFFQLCRCLAGSRFTKPGGIWLFLLC